MEVDVMQDFDFNWFKEHLSELYKQYGDSYLAIKNKTVIDRRGTIVCPKRLCVVKSATKCDFRLISHAQILRQINRLLDVVCDLISRVRRCALH